MYNIEVFLYLSLGTVSQNEFILKEAFPFKVCQPCCIHFVSFSFSLSAWLADQIFEKFSIWLFNK